MMIYEIYQQKLFFFNLIYLFNVLFLIGSCLILLKQTLYFMTNELIIIKKKKLSFKNKKYMNFFMRNLITKWEPLKIIYN